jgi:spoIIIJ-associated protein
MEWIETFGKTVDEAVERALRELGIAEPELEYHVLRQPKSGFLGIGAAQAHVRARVKPISREKPDRRRRRRGEGRGDGRGGPRSARDRRPQGARSRGRNGEGGGQDRREERTREPSEPGGQERREPAGEGGRGRSRSGRGRRGSGSQRVGNGNGERETTRQETTVREMTEMEIAEQVQVAKSFTEGLMERFGVTAAVTAESQDDYVVVNVEGPDLGLLIGRDGATMQAMRELVKTALQRHTEGQSARVRLDVGGYDQRRRAALEEFARGLAARAAETGKDQALEPMSASDRKVVHDAVNEIEGVTTISEGEEPRRRVVIRPA